MTLRAIEARDLDAIVALCAAEGWPSYPSDSQRAWRAMTAPGVTTIVAIEDGRVAGFIQVQSDTAIQGHVTLIAVAAAARRRGLGRRLIEEAFARTGVERLDLLSVAGAEAFYRSLPHSEHPGFRIYPPTK